MEWQETDALPEALPSPMQQHPAYGRACRAGGARTIALRAGPHAAPQGWAQILIRRWPGWGPWALLARGPVWAEDLSPAAASTALASLIAQLRRRYRGVITTADLVRGADPLSDAGLLPITSAAHLARLSLAGDPAARLARQHGKWRNRLRRAQSAGLTLREETLPPTGLHWLQAREAAQARARRYRRLPPRFTRHWADANGPGSVRIFAAYEGSQPLAGMLFLRHGPGASYHAGWSSDRGRACNAHNLLLWQAGETLAEEGCPWIDLGTLDTVTSPGLARFKLGSGARAMGLGQSWLDAPGARTLARLTGAAPPRHEKAAAEP